MASEGWNNFQWSAYCWLQLSHRPRALKSSNSWPLSSERSSNRTTAFTISTDWRRARSTGPRSRAPARYSLTTPSRLIRPCSRGRSTPGLLAVSPSSSLGSRTSADPVTCSKWARIGDRGPFHRWACLVASTRRPARCLIMGSSKELLVTTTSSRCWLPSVRLMASSPAYSIKKTTTTRVFLH